MPDYATACVLCGAPLAAGSMCLCERHQAEARQAVDGRRVPFALWYIDARLQAGVITPGEAKRERAAWKREHS